jgi:hypothetical protein
MPQPDLLISRIPQGCGGTSGVRSSASPFIVTKAAPAIFLRAKIMPEAAQKAGEWAHGQSADDKRQVQPTE